MLFIFILKVTEAEGEYFIHGTKLERLIITHTKYFGIWFDQNFKWTHYVDMVVKKATQIICFIHRNIHNCPKSFKEATYT